MQKNIKEIIPTVKLKNQVEKYITTKSTDITWYNGTYMKIERANIEMIQPIKIVVNKNNIHHKSFT